MSSAEEEGQFYRHLRERVGLEQEDAAQRLGIHRVTLSRYENGKAAIGPELKRRLMEVYNAAGERAGRAPLPRDPAAATNSYQLGVIAGQAQAVRRFLQSALEEQERVIAGLAAAGASLTAASAEQLAAAEREAGLSQTVSTAALDDAIRRQRSPDASGEAPPHEATG